MNKVKSIVNILIIFIIIGMLAGSVYANLGNTVLYNCIVMHKVYTLKLSVFMLGMTFLGLIFGFTLCSLVNSRTQKLCNAYQKRNENIVVQSESDKAEIATLEAKIQTLETALQSMINKNK